MIAHHETVKNALLDTPIKVLRAKVAKLYSSDGFQKFVAVLLLANFCLNVIDAEFADDREAEMKSEEGSGKYARLASYFDITDMVFTVFYIIELLLNLFANWWRPFINDGWSIFGVPFVCVCVS